MDSSWVLKANSVIPYFSTGTTQLYHVLEDLLLQTGKADVFISSFTVAEEFIRKLNQLKKQDLIQDLRLLIDNRSAKKTLHLSYFLLNVADEVYLANNHSKIILISNEKYKVSIVTSQNQTRGNRYEAGLISTIKETYDFFDKALEQEKTNYLKLTDVFNRPVRKD